MIALAFTCAACSGSFDIPPRPQVIEAAPIVDEPTPKCFVRARRFNGLVQLPCVDLIRQTRG
jgi:hypothetical protein